MPETIQFSQFAHLKNAYPISLRALKQQFSKMADPGNIDVHESSARSGVESTNHKATAPSTSDPESVYFKNKNNRYLEHF